MSCGVTAAVGATYSFMGPLALRVMEAFNKGDIEKARKLQNQYLEAVQTMTRH
ncbi:hypothetical protein TNIN_496661, partial [Trichonephila inaurata madagascariensis]